MLLKSSAVAAAVMALSGLASAQGTESMFRISGFGTLGLVQTNTDDATFTTGGQSEGATTSANLNPDSKLGIQLDAKFNDTLSATIQLFSRQDFKSSVAPGLEWAFVKAKLNKNINVRVGRMGAPFFMASDFRNVGYTTVSLRTPVDVYGLVPIRYFDGADALFQFNAGDAVINAQLWGGKANALAGYNSDGEINIQTNSMVGLSVIAEMGSLTLRAGHMKTTLGTDGGGLKGFNSLVANLKATAAATGLTALSTIANDISVDGKAASFSGIGLTYDEGNVVVSGEYVMRKTDSLYVQSDDAYYVTLGYRMGVFTPYATYSKRTQSSAVSVTAPSTTGFPTPVPQTVAALIGGVNTGVLSDSSNSTIAIGVRWDLGKSYALKGEIAQTTTPAGAVGVYRAIKGGKFATDTNINVFSLAVDFVF